MTTLQTNMLGIRRKNSFLLAAAPQTSHTTCGHGAKCLTTCQKPKYHTPPFQNERVALNKQHCERGDVCRLICPARAIWARTS